MPQLLNLNPDLLRSFVTVVDCGGFSQAAEQLMRGQSAVSLQIKRLEDQIGVRLLERTPRSISLTPEGALFLEDARALLRHNDDIVARYLEPEVSGSVRLGAPEDFATSHLPTVLSRFSSRYPKVALEITCELTIDLVRRFKNGGLDMALIKQERGTGEMRRGSLRVWREPLVWVARSKETIQGDQSLPLAVSPDPCVYRRRAISALKKAHKSWRIAYTCGSLAGIHAAVRAGLGVAVLPKEMVPRDLTVLYDDTTGLPALEDTEIALVETVSLSPAALLLRDYIINELEHAKSA